MKAKHAERIRFGILSARFDFAGHRLTFDQRFFLAEHHEWIVGDFGTMRAYERECMKQVRQHPFMRRNHYGKGACNV